MDTVAYLMNRCSACCNVSGIDLGSRFVTHGAVDALYQQYGLDAQSIANHVMEVLKVEN